MRETEHRQTRTTAPSREERPNLRAKYSRLAIPAVVAAVLPGKAPKVEREAERSRRDFSRD